MLIFASQSEPKRAKYTHSWGTFVRVGEHGQGVPPTIHAHTISWMPATLDIHPLRLRVEPGVNLDLCTTIREMLKNDERVSLWGPYEIRRGLYLKSVMQKQFLESGCIGYQCIDTVGEAARRGNGCDCIHAMTDMDSKFDRGNYPLRKFGEAASEHVVKQVIDRDGIINPCVTHDWLLGPLGVAECPMIRREDDGRRTLRERRSAQQATADR